MANRFKTPSYVAPEMVRLMEQELILGNQVGIDMSDAFVMRGSSVTVRRQAQYLGQNDNLDVSAFTEDVTEGFMTVSMNKTWSDRVLLAPLDETLSFDRWSDMVLKPLARRAAEVIENSIASQYYKFYNFAGTPGTPPSTFAELADAGAYMDDVGIPISGRMAFHPPVAAAKFANAVAASNVQSRNASAMDKAMIGYFAGFDNYRTAFAPTHTVGPLGGTPLVNGGAQNVTYDTVAAAGGYQQTLITDGWTAAAAARVKAGDVFTITGVNSVHPGTKADTGRLQTFTILADGSSDGAGNLTLTISPPMITSGAYKTVTAAPADNAALTIKTGTASTGYRQSLLLDPQAITMVSRPIAVEEGTGLKTSLSKGNRVQVRVSEYTDGNTLNHYLRMDTLWGIEVTDPRRGLRMTS